MPWCRMYQKNSERIIVNGANGVLGRVLLTKLSPNYAVAAARRATLGFPSFVLVPSDGEASAQSLKGIHAIINCAGLVKGSRSEIWQANVEHPVRLAEIAKAAGVRKFIQLSSFSVFGQCEHINSDTKFGPVSDYGKSKLAAEQQLLKLNATNFNVTVLRVPFMFGVQNHAMMGSLINALKRFPFFPISCPTAYRSILTYSDAAELLIQATRSNKSMVRTVADPQLFSVVLLAKLMNKDGLRSARLLGVPSFAVNASRIVAPRLAERLFGGNILLPEFNWASDVDLKTGIFNEIGNILSTTRLNGSVKSK